MGGEGGYAHGPPTSLTHTHAGMHAHMHACAHTHSDRERQWECVGVCGALGAGGYARGSRAPQKKQQYF